MNGQQPKPVECKNGCGQLIYFDRKSDNGWSQSGKMVPLQWDEDKGPTDTGHQCPNSDYNKRQRGQTTTTVSTVQDKTPSGIEMILGNTLDILGKVELIVQRVESYGKQLYAIQTDVQKIKAKLAPEDIPDTTTE